MENVDSKMPTDLIPPEIAAQRLRVGVRTINTWARKGEMECVQLSPRKRRFTSDQLKKFIETRTRAMPKNLDRPKSKRLPCPSTIQKGGVNRESFGVFAKTLRKEMSEWK